MAGCVVAAATLWISQNGENAVDGLRGKPALTTHVRIVDPDEYAVAFGRGPLSREDFARLRLTGDDNTLQELVRSYGGVRAGSLGAQIVLTGGRNQLTILDIAIKRETRRVEPLTGGLAVKVSEGRNESPRLSVDLDRHEPFLEIKDKPGVRYFDTETITLKRDEDVTLQVDFQADAGYHEFSLEVTYLLAGTQEKRVIAGLDNGLFRVSGKASDYRAYSGELYVVGSGGGERMTSAQICDFFETSEGCR